MGKADGDPKILVGDLYDETKAGRSTTLRSWTCFLRMVLSYTVGDWDQALKEADDCNSIIYDPLGSTDNVLYVPRLMVLFC